MSSSIHGFFHYARERYRILLVRRAGSPKPWTEDEILRRYRFCNVFREDDTTTRWFRENVRHPLRDSDDVLRATLIFRWFNRVSTCERLHREGLLTDWDTGRAKTLLRGVSPLVTGAYIVKTPDGMSKLDGVCWCVDAALELEEALLPLLRDARTLRGGWEVLTRLPYLGSFMAYEVISDLRHTALFEGAADILDWAAPGPGCARGIGRVFHQEPAHYSYASAGDRAKMLDHMRHLLLLSTQPNLWPRAWPRWEMREVEHTLCEFDKYERVRRGEGAPRQRYAGT